MVYPKIVDMIIIWNSEKRATPMLMLLKSAFPKLMKNDTSPVKRIG